MSTPPPGSRPERFDAYMERCLYGPDGFYATDGTAGRRTGDFLTSPEVGPLFGAVLAEAIDAWWDELGRPDPLVVYDVGCGPGALLRSIATARGGRPWRLVGVDRSEGSGAAGSDAGAETRNPEPTSVNGFDIEFRTTLPADLTGAIVVANELLDNLPFRWIVAADGGAVEVHVDDGSPVTMPAGRLASGVFDQLAIGRSAPLLEQAAAWVESVLDAGAARLCVFDYGAATTTELAERGGWLRTYRSHQRGDDPFREPGRWDITTDVAWDQLPAPATLSRQAEFLRTWQIDRLVDEGRAYWTDHAARPDLTAFRMRSRISEAEALLDPDGLGGWLAAVWASSNGPDLRPGT